MAPFGYLPYSGGYPPMNSSSYLHLGGYPPMPYGGYPPMPAGLGYPPPALPSLCATPGVVNITSSITIRLTSKNYLFWKAQVAPLLRSKLLMGYVDGSLVCPLPHTRLLIMAGLRCRNPTQPNLPALDSAGPSYPLRLCVVDVRGRRRMVMFASTSHKAWETLAGAFIATSFARSSGLRQHHLVDHYSVDKRKIFVLECTGCSTSSQQSPHGLR
jgi:hypothetical protein